MASKTISKTVRVCDACEKEAGYCGRCINCHKDYCYECQRSHMVELKHSVWASGSGDISFCHKCYASPNRENVPILLAYQKIAALRVECKAWNEDFEKRSKAAESEAKTLHARYE